MNRHTVSECDCADATPARGCRWLTPGVLIVLVALLVIVADQSLKLWVKTTFYIGEDLPLTPWWHLKFIENNGMAFGMELGSKIFLTLGRIIAVALFVWFIVKVRAIEGLRRGFLVAMALITAGAAGNIFDCVFYGVIFDNPMPPAVAEFLPACGGYAGWFEGRVVDMLYFPLFEFIWPEWVPVVGGTGFEFFQYIFNIADASICVGVAMLICFYSRDLSVSFNTLQTAHHGRRSDSRTE